MFFFIREREVLLGDVSTDVVKSESRVDSRNLHCRTSSKDSTSETARERKDRAQRERSPVMTFSRKLSFIMRMRALMDGHWRAIRAMLLAEGEGFVSPAQLGNSRAWPASCCRESTTQLRREDMVRRSAQLYS